MGEQAKITSMEVLERFRASLVIFLTKARRSLDHAGEEVRRTQTWLLGEQRQFWEMQIKRRQKVLDRVTQELLTAKLSALRDNTTVQENAVRKAKRDMHEAEEKIRRIKHWGREFERMADPMVRRLERLRQFLDHDLPMATAYLVEAQKTLESYAGTALTAAEASLPPIPETESPPPIP